MKSTMTMTINRLVRGLGQELSPFFPSNEIRLFVIAARSLRNYGIETYHIIMRFMRLYALICACMRCVRCFALFR